VHAYQWLWEPLETDPTFLLRPMFGGKAAYLDGKLMLYFSAKEEPWRGLLVCTDRAHHESLRAEFSAIAPHPILPKWLYLPESDDRFERVAELIVTLARAGIRALVSAPTAKNARSRAAIVSYEQRLQYGPHGIRHESRGPFRLGGFRAA